MFLFLGPVIDDPFLFVLSFCFCCLLLHRTSAGAGEQGLIFISSRSDLTRCFCFGLFEISQNFHKFCPNFLNIPGFGRHVRKVWDFFAFFLRFWAHRSYKCFSEKSVSREKDKPIIQKQEQVMALVVALVCLALTGSYEHFVCQHYCFELRCELQKVEDVV